VPKRLFRFSFLLITWILTVEAACGTTLEGIRVWGDDYRTRVVLDISGTVQYRIFTLKHPTRVVLDIKSTHWKSKSVPSIPSSSTLLKIRSAQRKERDLRVVLDLKEVMQPKAFQLKPYAQYGHRLVVDLEPITSKPVYHKAPKNGQPYWIIAIDAGHGGEDPGAIGPGNTQEKDVVLAVAKKLAAIIAKKRGYHPVLIRKSDIYIGLRERIKLARRYEADVFVSLHADAFFNNTAAGASVYALSHRGASDEAARWLAMRENASDLIGGVSLIEHDDLVASVLLDLSQKASMHASLDLGENILTRLGDIGHLHKKKVEQARFVVLKSPDIPSVLVEMGFISHPGEERKLKSSAYQYKLASSIWSGIQQYLISRPAPRILASRRNKHIIESGDTLSALASRYDVSISYLRTSNNLNSDLLKVGQVLIIPSGS